MSVLHYSKRFALVGAVALAVGGFAMQPALAEKPAHAGGGKPAHVGKGKPDHAGGGKAKHHRGGGERQGVRGQDNGGVDIDVVFTARDRDTVRRYYSDGYASRGCPPGLAKKNNGCLPPGQAKKYGRGDIIPDDVVLYPVDDELRVRLPRLPSGYIYRRVDGEVLVIAEAARKVIDIAVLLSTL